MQTLKKVMLSIPVVIDDVKSLPGFQMSRCSYFSVQSDDPSPGWTLSIGAEEVPFLMLGLSGIVSQPSSQERVFDMAEKFEELFETVELNDDIYIDLNDIWLPNFVFTSCEVKRGDLYRVGQPIFVSAYRYRNDAIGKEEFLASCRELQDSVRYSAVETEALRLWAGKEIEGAKAFYREHPDLRLGRKRSEG